MKPRNLRLMRINDVLVEANMEAPPDTIDIFEVAMPQEKTKLWAIRSWRTAMDFWYHGDWKEIPDLVVSDVLFEDDRTTPLGKVQPFENYQKPIPTGLSHLKPFAALARGRGAILGIGIHTGNPDMWKTLFEGGHPMGYLAAHEIGELAAILKDCLVEDGQMPESLVQNCWVWLNKNVKPHFNDALDIALANFRRQLIKSATAELPGHTRTVMVSPMEWQKLISWAESMSKQPRPIEPDYSIPLLYADGKRDCLRLTSLFADCPNLSSEKLPGTCFETAIDSGLEPWKLDHSGLPQIGLFIKALGSMSDVYEQACKLVKHFPILLTESTQLDQNIRSAAKGCLYEQLTIGLAVLFRAIEWEHCHYQAWQDDLVTVGWDPRAKRLEPHSTNYSLETILSRLYRQIKAYITTSGEREINPGDVIDNWEWFDASNIDSTAEWVSWHFEKLVSAGVLIQKSRVEYALVKSNKPLIIPPPSILPDGFVSPSLGKELKKALADSLGFSKAYGPGRSDNPNGIAQCLGSAFVKNYSKLSSPEQNSSGREFLNNALEGELPFWLAELCKNFLENDLNWDDPSTWPQWIRTHAGSNPQHKFKHKKRSLR